MPQVIEQSLFLFIPERFPLDLADGKPHRVGRVLLVARADEPGQGAGERNEEQLAGDGPGARGGGGGGGNVGPICLLRNFPHSSSGLHFANCMGL